MRACADDIGSCLSRLKHLKGLVPIFSDASKLAGLNLNTIKCNIVPLCSFSEKVKNDILKWISRNIPEWKNFSVAPSTKLLGLYLGPEAGKMNWSEQVHKMKTRVQTIQNAQASSSINAYSYNTKVIPVSSYVAQLLPPPKRLNNLKEGSCILC